MAEGVRLYCQETWKLVTEMKGAQLVEKYITHVSHTIFNLLLYHLLNYIIPSLNFMRFIDYSAGGGVPREAACAGIAELGTKV